MSLDLICKKNVGRVVMVDIRGLVNGCDSGDFGKHDWVASAVMTKIVRDTPAALLESILTIGFTTPILVRLGEKRPIITNGHHRLMLALFSGFTEIPVFVSDGVFVDWHKSEDHSLPDSYVSTKPNQKKVIDYMKTMTV